MGKSPAFQFYASDFLTDTQSWEVEEVGIYIRLLSNQWVNGSLPNDLKRLSRIAGCDLKAIEKAWVILAFKFLVNIDGEMYNKKLEQIRDTQQAFSKKQSDNGLKGGRPSKIKTKQNPNETQKEAKQKPNKSSSSSSSIRKYIKENFDVFWDKYPNKVGKEKSYQRFIKLPDCDIEKIINTIDDFLANKPFETYNFPNPETYLNNKRWEDEVVKVKKEVYQGYVPNVPN